MKKFLYSFLILVSGCTLDNSPQTVRILMDVPEDARGRMGLTSMPGDPAVDPDPSSVPGDTVVPEASEVPEPEPSEEPTPSDEPEPPSDAPKPSDVPATEPTPLPTVVAPTPSPTPISVSPPDEIKTLRSSNFLSGDRCYVVAVKIATEEASTPGVPLSLPVCQDFVFEGTPSKAVSAEGLSNGEIEVSLSPGPYDFSLYGLSFSQPVVCSKLTAKDLLEKVNGIFRYAKRRATISRSNSSVIDFSEADEDELHNLCQEKPSTK